MKDLTGYRREFSWTGKAYYRDHVIKEDVVDEVCFGLYNSKGGGTIGEMLMIWKDLQDKVVPRLHVYDDAWFSMSSFDDLWRELAKHDNENITPQDFVDILKSCAFKDNTPYKEE